MFCNIKTTLYFYVTKANNMKSGVTKMNGKEVTVIALDSMTKEESKIIYQFLGASVYPHQTYYILNFTDKKITEKLRDAMIKDVYNKAEVITKVMNAATIADLIRVWETYEFEFDAN